MKRGLGNYFQMMGFLLVFGTAMFAPIFGLGAATHWVVGGAVVPALVAVLVGMPISMWLMDIVVETGERWMDRYGS